MVYFSICFVCACVFLVLVLFFATVAQIESSCTPVGPPCSSCLTVLSQDSEKRKRKRKKNILWHLFLCKCQRWCVNLLAFLFLNPPRTGSHHLPVMLTGWNSHLEYKDLTSWRYIHFLRFICFRCLNVVSNSNFPSFFKPLNEMHL